MSGGDDPAGARGSATRSGCDAGASHPVDTPDEPQLHDRLRGNRRGHAAMARLSP